MVSRRQLIDRLGLEHPLDREARVLASRKPSDTRHGTGWTYRLCMEAACDVLRGNRVILVAENDSDQEGMVQAVQELVGRYRNGVCNDTILSAETNLFLDVFGDTDSVVDGDGNALLAYVDHWRNSSDCRILGPFGEIRTARIGPDGVKTFDFDGNYLLDLDPRGLHELRTEHRHRIAVTDLQGAAVRNAEKAINFARNYGTGTPLGKLPPLARPTGSPPQMLPPEFSRPNRRPGLTELEDLWRNARDVSSVFQSGPDPDPTVDVDGILDAVKDVGPVLEDDLDVDELLEGFREE